MQIDSTTAFIAGFLAGAIVSAFFLQKQIRELRKRCTSLEALGSTDVLTGLQNRRAGEDVLTRRLSSLWIEAGHRRTSPGGLAVLFIDLDHFKAINDTHGHAVGDAVLKAAAQAARSALRASDVLCRWGGEEFIAIVSEVDKTGALVVADKVRQAVTAVRITEVPELQVTTSIGLAWTDKQIPKGELIGSADAALYEAKTAGRNRVVFAAQ